MKPSTPDRSEWVNAIEDAEQVMLRWGHGQVRRVPDEIVEAIVAALRAPVSERLTPSADAVKLAAEVERGAWRDSRGALQIASGLTLAREILRLTSSNERPDSTKENPHG